LDKHIRNSMESKTLTGTGLCPAHQDLYDKGYIALVEVTSPSHGANIKLEDADRTGAVCHLSREVADDIFNIKLSKTIPMVFVEPSVIEKLQNMIEKENK
jgi:hypothetical protein